VCHSPIIFITILGKVQSQYHVIIWINFASNVTIAKDLSALTHHAEHAQSFSLLPNFSLAQFQKTCLLLTPPSLLHSSSLSISVAAAAAAAAAASQAPQSSAFGRPESGCSINSSGGGAGKC
jgi:hypothetical protein